LNCNYNHVTSGYDGYYVTNVMRFWVGDGDPYGHTIDGHYYISCVSNCI